MFDCPYNFFYRKLEINGRDPRLPAAEAAAAAAAAATATAVGPSPSEPTVLDPSLTIVTSATRSLATGASVALMDVSSVSGSVSDSVSDSGCDSISCALVSSSLAVCPGLADAITADNQLFFQDELASAVGQTTQQRALAKAGRGASGGGGSGSDGGGGGSAGAAVASTVAAPASFSATPAAFFLHKIQSEVRRKHQCSQPWGDTSTIKDGATAAATTSVLPLPPSPASSLSSVCHVCHLLLSSSGHASIASPSSSSVCPFSVRACVECPHCFAVMSSQQLGSHVRTVGNVVASYRAIATANKCTLPAEWQTGNMQQATCANAMHYQHESTDSVHLLCCA